MKKFTFIGPLCQFFLVLTTIVISTSCTEDNVSETSAVKIQHPDVVEIDGVKWQRESSLGAADTKLLSRFFELNPSMGDSPNLTGSPTVYHATKKRRRFFWINESATEPIWTCIAFSNGKFHLQEGQGSPYQDTSN